jgi:integrase
MTRDKYDPRDHHLWRSPGGMIYLKLAIPAEVRDRFPRAETGKVKDRITESLGTDSWADARILRDQRLAHWQRAFARLAGGAALSPEEVAVEHRRVHRKKLQALLAMPEEAMGAAFRAGPQTFVPALVTELAAEVRAMADEKYGIGTIAAGSKTWNELLMIVVSAEARAFEDRLLSMLRARVPSVVPLDEQPTTPAPTLPANNGNGNGGLERFSVALDHYLAWLRNERQATVATVADYRSKAERFAKFADDPSLGAVTIDDAKAFLNDVAKDTEAGTVNLYHQVCKAVFEHARNERHRFYGDNPFSFKRRKHTVKSKAKFTVEELNKLFNSPTFTGREIKPKTYSVASALPWMAAIALYSGAGLEEVCQLRPKDIKQEAGIWVIEIMPEAALSGALKRSARKRIVPLHPELERLGVLRYVTALPRTAQRLFPNLPIGKRKGKYGGASGKAFKRWRDKLGIDYADRQLDFHSLRHVFLHAVENAGISQSDAARLAGHKVAGITFGVYSAPELKRLAQVIKRIKYKGLKID